MAEFKDLIKCLCTEEMIEKGTGIKVKVKEKIGYLVAYDVDLGFTFVTVVDYVGENIESELGEDDIDIETTLVAKTTVGSINDAIIAERVRITNVFSDWLNGGKPHAIGDESVKAIVELINDI